MADEKKPDCVLSDGRPIFFDFWKVSTAEWRSMFKPEQAEEAGDAVMAKVTGLAVAEISALPLPDFRILSETMMRKSRDPLAVPETASATEPTTQ